MNRLNHPGSKGYLRKVRRVEPASLIGYWPLNEQADDAARDWSGADRHGKHTAVGYMGTGIGDGMRCLAYDGTTSYTNIYSAALASAFNGAEGTLMIWAKVSAAGVWTDATWRYPVELYVDANNFIQIGKRGDASNYIQVQRVAGGTDTQQNHLYTTGPTTWISIGFTWSASADKLKLYIDGSQSGADVASLGTWVGSLASTAACVGAGSTDPAGVWSGSLAHCALWSKALAPGDIKFLASP